MRTTSTLAAGVVLVVALLSSGVALAQPASTGDAGIDPVDTQTGQGLRITFGAGVGVAPDYEGSDDYELVPLWNLRVANLYHPQTFIQLFGPRLRSNFLPSDHWRLGLAGQFIPKTVRWSTTSATKTNSSVAPWSTIGSDAGHDAKSSLERNKDDDRNEICL